jgi:hypothetical protein
VQLDTKAARGKKKSYRKKQPEQHLLIATKRYGELGADITNLIFCSYYDLYKECDTLQKQHEKSGFPLNFQIQLLFCILIVKKFS